MNDPRVAHGPAAMRERGRELKPSELRERTVVLLEREGRPQVRVSMWVSAVHRDTIDFYSGVLDLTLRCTRMADDTLTADTDKEGRKRVHVYEFLGEV